MALAPWDGASELICRNLARPLILRTVGTFQPRVPHPGEKNDQPGAQASRSNFLVLTGHLIAVPQSLICEMGIVIMMSVMVATVVTKILVECSGFGSAYSVTVTLNLLPAGSLLVSREYRRLFRAVVMNRGV